MADKYEVEGAKALKSTTKALLVSAPEFEEPVWIPQSQIDDDSEVYEVGDEGKLIVSIWFATQRGWT